VRIVSKEQGKQINAEKGMGKRRSKVPVAKAAGKAATKVAQEFTNGCK